MTSTFKQLAIVTLLALIGCSKNDSIPTLDFTKEYTPVKTDLTELMDNIKILQLEEIKNTPLSGYGDVIVSDDYIVHFDSNAIYQFSSNGEFIRVVATKGQGPNEFLRLNCQTQLNGILTYYDFPHPYLTRYNLKTGEFEKRRKAKGAVSLSANSDTSYVYIPSTREDYMLASLSHNGTIYGKIKRTNFKKPKTQIFYMTRRILIKSTDESHLFLPSNVIDEDHCIDTLYRYTSNTLQPEFIIKSPQKIREVNKRESLQNYPVAMSGNNILIKSYHRVTKNSSLKESSSLFRYNTDNERLTLLDICFEKYGICFKDDIVPRYRSHNRLAIAYHANDFKELLKESLIREDLSNRQRGALKKLDSNIKEDGHLVLITGDLKRD